MLYALSRWEALRGYRDDGELEIDNSPVERALRKSTYQREHSFAGKSSYIATPVSDRAAVRGCLTTCMPPNNGARAMRQALAGHNRHSLDARVKQQRSKLQMGFSAVLD